MARFGILNITEKHSLDNNLLDELVFRGILVEADASVSEMLYNLVNVTFPRVSTQGQQFHIQLLRAEQTAAFAV